MAFLRNILWFYAPATDEYKIPLDVAKSKTGSRHRAGLYEKCFRAFSFGESNPSESNKFRLFATVWEQLSSLDNNANAFLTDFSKQFAAIDFSSIQKAQPEVVQMLQQLGPLYRFAFTLDLWESMQDKQRQAARYAESTSVNMQKLLKETTQVMADLSSEIDQFLVDIERKQALFKEKCDFLKTPAGRAHFEAKKQAWTHRCQENDNVFERELTRLTLAIDDLEHELEEANDFSAIQAKKEQLHVDLLVWRDKSAVALPDSIIESMLEPLQTLRLHYQSIDEVRRQLQLRYHKIEVKKESDLFDIQQTLQLLTSKKNSFFLTAREIELAHALLAEDKQVSTIEKTIIDVVRTQYYKYQGVSAYVVAAPAVDVWNPGVTEFVSSLCSQRAMINTEAVFYKSQHESKLVLEKQIIELALLSKNTLMEYQKKLADTHLHSRTPGFSECLSYQLFDKVDHYIRQVVQDTAQGFAHVSEQLRNEQAKCAAENNVNRAHLIAKCDVQIARLDALEKRKSQLMTKNQQLLTALSHRPAFAAEFELPSPTPKAVLGTVLGMVSGFSITSGAMLALQVGLTGLVVSNPIGWGVGLLALGTVMMVGAMGLGMQAYNRHIKNKLLTLNHWTTRAQQQLFVQNDVLKNATAEQKIRCPRSTRQVMMACGIVVSPQTIVAQEEIPCQLTNDKAPPVPLYFNKSTGSVYFKKPNASQPPITPESPEFFKILGRTPRQA